MKTKTLEDALFDTGAPDEIILLAMVEACKQDNYEISKMHYVNCPFIVLMVWYETYQGENFWMGIDDLYRIR